MLPKALGRALIGVRPNHKTNGTTAASAVGTGFRAFRAETPDAEARGGENDNDQFGSPIACGTAPGAVGRKQGTAGSTSRLQGPSSTGGEQQQEQPERKEPVRSAQPHTNQPERRRVLAPGRDEFLGNFATLLVRWPHAHLHKAPRSWREALESDRFQYLFPRRPPPLAREAVKTFEALARAAEAAAADEEHGSGGAARSSGSSDADGLGPTEAGGRGLMEAHHAALSELLERLHAMQQQMQDADDGSGDSTIIAVAALTDEDLGDHGEDDTGSSGRFSGSSGYQGDDRIQAHAAASPSTLKHGDEPAECKFDGPHCGGGTSKPWSGTLGRRMRNPCARRQHGKRPAPPWDDTLPFQTHVGTVYHFWRLCPYG